MRLLAVCLAALCLAGPVCAQPTVYLTAHDDTLRQSALVDDLPAFQHAVTVDLAHYWNTDATLTLAPRTGDWSVTVTDQPGPCGFFGCVLGYHGVGRHGVPYAVIFASSCDAFHVAWQAALTHELFEMLVDPWADRGELRAGAWRIIEVSDPVAGWQFTLPSATGKPVPISDFVTPAWFRPGAEGRYDLLQKLSAPLQLGAGGYMSVWDPQTKTWGTFT